MEYDVLGNERHKAICKLSDMPKLYPNKDGGADLYAWKSELADAIGADTELFSAIRDRLIHLLGGDQPKFSELFGILREDDDGVDARPSDSASADSLVHDSAGCACGVACGCDGEEPLAPITTELREYMETYRPIEDAGHVVVSRIGTIGFEGFDRLCDNIDAIHAGLERENEELRKRTMYPSETERVNMLEREVKRLTSECKTQRNNFDQATSAREHWKNLYEQALEQIHDLERDYKTACYINERQDCEYADLAKRYDKTITLPFDKDGKVWDVGDELLDDGMVCEVVGIGPNRLYYYCDATDTVEWTQADSRRHYLANTVEDVLSEFFEEVGDGLHTLKAVDTQVIIAKYAAKLKLADA